MYSRKETVTNIDLCKRKLLCTLIQVKEKYFGMKPKTSKYLIEKMLIIFYTFGLASPIEIERMKWITSYRKKEMKLFSHVIALLNYKIEITIDVILSHFFIFVLQVKCEGNIELWGRKYKVNKNLRAPMQSP